MPLAVSQCIAVNAAVMRGPLLAGIPSHDVGNRKRTAHHLRHLFTGFHFLPVKWRIAPARFSQDLALDFGDLLRGISVRLRGFAVFGVLLPV